MRITSKCQLGAPAPGTALALLESSLEVSCRAMRLDHVDAFFLHSNICEDDTVYAHGHDRRDSFATPWSQYVEEVAPALAFLKSSGRVAAWGITGVGVPSAVERALGHELRPDVVQIVTNLLDSPGAMRRYAEAPRPRALLNAAVEQGVGIMGIRAVQAGALTSGIDRTLSDTHPEVADFQRAEPYRALCDELGEDPRSSRTATRSGWTASTRSCSGLRTVPSSHSASRPSHWARSPTTSALESTTWASRSRAEPALVGAPWHAADPRAALAEEPREPSIREHATTGLAVRAVHDLVGRVRDALESSAASRAGRAGSAVDREAIAERGVREAAGPLPLGVQCLVEDFADAGEQPCSAVGVERVEGAERREAGAVQRAVVGIAAADPRDRVLVAEQGVEVASVLAVQHELGEGWLPGLRSEPRERSVVVRGEDPEPRSPLGAVLADEQRGIAEHEAREGAARPRLLRGSLEVDAPAVAEVDQGAPGGSEVEGQELPAARRSLEWCADEVVRARCHRLQP